MKAKAAAGIALALTVALVGCSPRGEGGGGGTTTKHEPAAAPAAVSEVSTPTGAHQNVLDATKNASAARSSAAKKDWTTAETDIKRTKQDLMNAEKGATGATLTNIKEAEQLANAAERSIKNKSATATHDLDKLVANLNQIAVREAPVQAGGGKPAAAPAAPAGTTTSLNKKAQGDLRDAAKNASEAKADLAKNDWNAANKNMNEVQDNLTDLSKNATPEMQANLKDVKRMADKAQADIKSHSSNSKQSLDNLVTHLSHLESTGVKAGGGKPMPEHKTK